LADREQLQIERGRPGACKRAELWRRAPGTMTERGAIRRLGAIAGILVLALALTGLAAARMKSLKLEAGLCETTGGGKFVEIPGFPGEKIDRRLLTDIRRLERRYKIFVTDGYSISDVHAANGEHPLGLALDIVPNKAVGGRWRQIDRLAAWAEPRPDRPRPPFRWVGYDGDANHGRGHHLHLSWSHSPAKRGRTARTVYTRRCPARATPPAPTAEPPLAGGTEVGAPVKDNDGGGSGGGDQDGGGGGGGPSGPGSGGIGGDGLGSGSGGIGGKLKLAPRVAERRGVDDSS
jgi:hypothetical protein